METNAGRRTVLCVAGLLLVAMAAQTLAAQDTLVALGSTWSYLDDGSDQGTAWYGTDFDDSGWASGPAELGYGDGDEATVVSYGPNASSKYVTTYFRHSFSVLDASVYKSMTLNVKRDDGVVVYLNGNEVFRNNMPGGMITYTTPSASAVEDSSFHSASIDVSSLVSGTNVLAAEVHQHGGPSSDISFDLQLEASTAPVTKEEALVAPGSTWSYLDDGSDQGTAWYGTDFDDSGWASGPAELGYGDGDEATVLSFGPDSNNKYATTYFRHTFSVSDPSVYPNLVLGVLSDDGAVVYLNGTEVFRTNMPGGTITYTSTASTPIMGSAEDEFNETIIDPGYLVAGTNLLAVEVHQNHGASSDISFDLKLEASTAPVAEEDALVAPGSTWSYLDDGSDQGTAWYGVGFDDSGWASGPAELGYGDGDEATVLSFGPDSNNKYMTNYFRHTFSVSDPSVYPNLVLGILRDDGAVVYLNGTEVFRTNIPSGTITYTSAALTPMGGSAENEFHEKIIDPGYLVAGTNLLAVEVHQNHPMSSDISFDLTLIGTTGEAPVAPVTTNVREGPYLIYPGDNTKMQVLWQLHNPESHTLRWGRDTSYSDGSATPAVYSNNQYEHTITGLTPGAMYYYEVEGVGIGSFLAAPPDWPMWRYDSNRSGFTSFALPPVLYLQWELVLPPLEPAWPDEPRITFDHYYAPIVLGNKMFVGSSRNDSVTAYDTDTGTEIWRFYADAPIRMAPAGWVDKLFVTSDDGFLYCLNAEDGALLWKFRGAPTDRKALGNKRLGSAWPARGAPTILDGTVYFAAGIWPFMGSFVYALDAATGDVVWINDGSGSIYMNQPHGGSVSFGALAPQGYLVAVGDRLVVPNGRAVAAGLDRNTGEFLYFHFQENNKNSTNHVAAFGEYFNNSGSLFRLSDGSSAGSLTDGAIMTKSENYADVFGNKVFCKAGDRLYTGSSDSIISPGEGRQRWEKSIPGTPACMLAGDNKLFVVTTEGRIYCYGGTNVSNPPVINKVVDPIAWPGEDQWTTKAQAVLAATGVYEGYCLVLGVGTGRLMEELAREDYQHSLDYPHPYDLHIIGIDPSADKIETLRRRWDDMGIPSERLSAFAGDIDTAQLPPYLAHLIVSEDLVAAGAANGDTFVEKVFYSLRPYGGQACFSSDALDLLQQDAATGGLANADVTLLGDFALLERVGALPGSADWTHNYADASNSVVSKDQLVKPPLGLLWFGGSTNGGNSYNRILPRHGHGPSEQVVAGRLFIEGPNIMRALDVYTGRVLWEADLPGVGVHYDYTSHVPGASAIGSNYASADDGVYVCYDIECRRLDPKNGAIISTFVITDPAYGGAIFSQVKIWDDLLIAAVDPVPYNGVVGHNNYSEASSRDLVVMNRHSGTILWQRRANHSFHHNTIIVGNDILYCIDRIPPGKADALSRRGIEPGDVGAPWELLALDVRTGAEIWSTTVDVFGTWLGYSEQYNVLLQSGRASRDMVADEPRRQIAYDGSSGMILWEQGSSAGGPCLLHGDMVIEQGSNGGNARDILTGATYMREHPITGSLVPWGFSRTYGCNTAVGCENLLTFRSGAAGYYDMRNNSGTGNFGGTKSGCSSNLIPANGVLNAPDYMRTCTCGYQNRTSMAMVHMPEAEMWTNTTLGQAGGPIEKVGINFGAPGDRLTDNGVLWLDYPSVGGSSPDIGVTCVPANPKWFRHHAAWFEDEGLGWVMASGAIGLTNVIVPVNNTGGAEYLVRLYFAEPENAEVGQRVFNIAIQGRQALNNFDIALHAGSDGSGIVREFRGINAAASLTLTFTPLAGQPVICGIELIRL